MKEGRFGGYGKSVLLLGSRLKQRVKLRLDDNASASVAAMSAVLIRAMGSTLSRWSARQKKQLMHENDLSAVTRLDRLVAHASHKHPAPIPANRP